MAETSDRVEYIKNIILNQLSARPRSRHELEKKLKEKEIGEDEYNPILDLYTELGLINDSEFARIWVSSRHQHKGLGRSALRQELRQKGVHEDTIMEVLEYLTDEDLYQKAYEVAEKKLSRMHHLGVETKTRRVVNLLVRKGYPPGLSYSIVRDILNMEAEFIDGDEEE